MAKKESFTILGKDQLEHQWIVIHVGNNNLDVIWTQMLTFNTGKGVENY